MIVTKSMLRRALFRWESENREGKCRSQEEVAAMTVDQVADENADHLWARMEASEEQNRLAGKFIPPNPV